MEPVVHGPTAHPINKALSLVGLRIARAPRVPREFMRSYRAQLRHFQASPPARFSAVAPSFSYEAGEHPALWWDFECTFAAEHIFRIKPTKILDIGSYRSFINGLLAHYDVTTVDVRSREPLLANETVITTDAKELDIPDESFELVLSMCSIEHFGVGRYGDEIDMEGDLDAFTEMVRVLKRGGHLIFTTTLRNGRPVLAFNEQRIYNVDLIHELTKSLTCEDERAYNREQQRFCRLDELPLDEDRSPRSWWHIYCGCWRKD
jgi:SAM-dependent methyltransferase